MSQHVHKFKRIVLGSKGYTVFKCQLPGCPSYVRKELAEGQLSICWKCGTELILTKSDLESVKPIHPECRKKRVAA